MGTSSLSVVFLGDQTLTKVSWVSPMWPCGESSHGPADVSIALVLFHPNPLLSV